MPYRPSASRFLVIALCLALSLVGVLYHAAAQSSNLLTNPGFEGTYTPFEADANRVVAPGWSAWNAAHKDSDPGYIVVPQYRDAKTSNVVRIRGGQSAQELFEFYAAFTGGVFQRIPVTPGTKLKFSVYMSVWSTSLNNPAKSEQPSRVILQVGIDPKGGMDGESSDVVYSTPKSLTGGDYDTFTNFNPLSVEATAAGNFVTVFTKAAFLDPVQFNHIYLDDAELVVSGLPSPTPTATLPPTVTLPPTNTLTAPTVGPGTPAASITAASPTATFTVTPSATPLPPTITPTATNAVGFSTPTQEGTTLPIDTASAPTTTVPIATPFLVNPTIEVPTLVPGTTIISYIVQPGDTVSGLAIKFNTTVEAIVAANNLNAAATIIVGQELKIAVMSTPTPIPPTPTLTVTPTLLSPTQTGNQPPVLTIPLTGPTVNGIGTYILQPGDTLEAVAQRYHISVANLAALNGIVNPNNIVIGQVLAVPGPGNNYPGGTVAPTRYPTVVGSSAPGSYTVMPGDNLFRISLKFNVSMAALMQANGLVDPNRIYVGQVLRIP